MNYSLYSDTNTNQDQIKDHIQNQNLFYTLKVNENLNLDDIIMYYIIIEYSTNSHNI